MDIPITDGHVKLRDSNLVRVYLKPGPEHAQLPISEVDLSNGECALKITPRYPNPLHGDLSGVQCCRTVHGGSVQLYRSAHHLRLPWAASVRQREVETSTEPRDPESRLSDLQSTASERGRDLSDRQLQPVAMQRSRLALYRARQVCKPGEGEPMCQYCEICPPLRDG